MKYRARYMKPVDWSTEGKIWDGSIWDITGSKGDIYEVEMHDNGFNCTCVGFAYHGKCKHVKSVIKRFDYD